MTSQQPPSGQPPYGQPPPPGGQPPPPGGQPPPPGQPPYGGQQPPGGEQPPPYGGQQPPYPSPGGGKSHTGLIAILAVVVLLVAGGAVAAVLLLGGDDSDSDSDSDTASQSIQGDGYSYTAPDGWEDASEQAAQQGTIDTAVRAAEASDGFRTNVLVEVGSAQGASDPEELRSTWESNILGALGESASEPEQIEGTTIDGQKAIGLRIESTQQDTDLVQVAYLAVNGGQVYSVTLTTLPDVEDESMDTFQGILDSWSWEG